LSSIAHDKNNPFNEEAMTKMKNLMMIVALAIVLGFGTACFGLFTGGSKPAQEAEIPECAGLSGQARVDCEAEHKKP
jgi:hypothetical protein